MAITQDLTAKRLLEAYPKGIFPWTENPVTWWSPDPRGILPLERLHIPRRLERTIRSGKFRFTVNQAFAEVIRGCPSRLRVANRAGSDPPSSVPIRNYTKAATPPPLRFGRATIWLEVCTG